MNRMIWLVGLLAVVGCGGQADSPDEESEPTARLLARVELEGQNVDFWQADSPTLGVQGPIILGISGEAAGLGRDPVSELRNYEPRLTAAELYWGLVHESPPAELLVHHAVEARALGRDTEFIEAVRLPIAHVAKDTLETDLWQDFPGWNETDKRTGKTTLATNGGVVDTLHTIGCSGYAAGGHMNDQHARADGQLPRVPRLPVRDDPVAPDRDPERGGADDRAAHVSRAALVRLHD